MLLKKLALTAAVSSTLVLSACSTNSHQDINLRHVLTVFSKSMDAFEPAEDAGSTKEASDSMMKEFTGFAQRRLNTPSFTEKPLGLELKSNGMFEGYTDENANKMRDSGEKTDFTIEIDTENNMLIATDMNGGGGADLRYSAAGFVAGAILGNLLSRQRRAGVSPSSKARAASKPSSAKSKSFSGSHSSGK